MMRGHTIDDAEVLTGGFTLPGQADKEALTLALADKWGADVIRDSDGTKLSDAILDSGYGIYSTVCLIREDLPWAKAHPTMMQQNFLMSRPLIAKNNTLEIPLLAGYSTQQFVINDWDGIDEFWQVHDRTTGSVLPRSQWAYHAADSNRPAVVTIDDAVPGHTYTVNFLVMRIWEEISMYNHTTNNWGDKEHLMALEPRHPEVAQHILQWLDNWCANNPATTVVRLTSLFYNFAWFWGSDASLPHIYTDWGSYDFTVNPIALREFKHVTGLDITAEDFVNGGRYTSTHNPPSDIYRKWMEFTWEFVLDLGRKCVEIIHKHGKQAYVFYDDSWVGLEPFSGRFTEYGFDGLIKAVFSGFEARLNAAVNVPVHELRLHPYLFPKDLEGRPTFVPEGNQTDDLLYYWVQVRPALIRARIDRIGLGGYLGLTEAFPDFQDAVAEIANEHRGIRQLHLDQEAYLSSLDSATDAQNDVHTRGGTASALSPMVSTSSTAGAATYGLDSATNAQNDHKRIKVGVITAWGKLRTWSTSGHFHENRDLSTMHVLEALSGLDFEVDFYSLQDIAEHGVPAGVDVLINAGPAGSAWSGGDIWQDPRLVTAVTQFVADGGGIIGIEAPSAVSNGFHTFALAEVFGIDHDAGDRANLHRRTFRVAEHHPITDRGANPDRISPTRFGPGALLVLRDDVEVLAEGNGNPTIAATKFGQGRAVYFATFSYDAVNVRLLENAIIWAAGQHPSGWQTSNPNTSVAAFQTDAGAPTIVLLNNSSDPQHTELTYDGEVRHIAKLEPTQMLLLK